MQTHFSIGDLPDATWFFLAKLTGAVLGSAVSIAYVLPKGKREAAIRFLVGVILGITMGPTTGLKIASYFNVNIHLSRFEVTLMGATIASLCAWWVLGVVRNILVDRSKIDSTKIQTKIGELHEK